MTSNLAFAAKSVPVVIFCPQRAPFHGRFSLWSPDVIYCSLLVKKYSSVCRMACLRFGTDALGKEILELVPAPAPANGVTDTTAPTPCSSSSAPQQNHEANGVQNKKEGGATQGLGAGDSAGLKESKPYKGENTIVMMEWERPYMRRLVDALGITGKREEGG